MRQSPTPSLKERKDYFQLLCISRGMLRNNHWAFRYAYLAVIVKISTKNEVCNSRGILRNNHWAFRYAYLAVIVNKRTYQGRHVIEYSTMFCRWNSSSGFLLTLPIGEDPNVRMTIVHRHIRAGVLMWLIRELAWTLSVSRTDSGSLGISMRDYYAVVSKSQPYQLFSSPAFGSVDLFWLESRRVRKKHLRLGGSPRV
jgi:hypothetical protein